MDVLARIRLTVLAGHYRFSEKALDEMETDDLTEEDVVASIRVATRIEKRLRSTSAFRSSRREHLYVIVSPNSRGVLIYTKGKFTTDESVETYYFLVSSKRSL